MVAQDTEIKDALITFRTSQGAEIRASLLSLTRYAVSFEVYSPDTVLKSSEVLEEFQIFAGDRPLYAGRAVVRDTVNTGTVLVCSAVLDDFCFDPGFFDALGKDGQLRGRFDEFVYQWQRVCKVLPEFKVIVADIETLLIDLRRWMEQIELGLRAAPQLDRIDRERETIDELAPGVIPVLDALFDKFEQMAARLPEDVRPLHRSYIQRHLHPIVLCAPFAYRTYRKPLGYAGDYEMVNMMLRDPREGSSLFAKVFNVWLLQQPSASAHRNRIEFLKRRLIEETATATRAGRTARILDLGCGPAREIQDFLAESELSNHAEFTLMDFNEETLQHAAQALRQKQQQYRRNFSVQLVKRSVQQLLKDMVRADGISRGNKFDFIYCAGLFDYLPDRTCKQLMTLFYQSLAPKGLVLTTNVSPFSPNRGSLELILDWHLIYRDAARVVELRPHGLSRDSACVSSDDTGVNVFLEVRADNDR
jgi:extracellular factor (EF) 3-hydroxypalmitic acid methyl ester biosynthesis protein